MILIEEFWTCKASVADSFIKRPDGLILSHVLILKCTQDNFRIDHFPFTAKGYEFKCICRLYNLGNDEFARLISLIGLRFAM